MKRLISGAALFVVLVVFHFLPSSQAEAARPKDQTSLSLQLSGEPKRWIMSDGGVSGMFGTGVQCMSVLGGDTLLLSPVAPVNLCLGPLDAGWDGGCSSTVTDLNFGAPMAADKYLSTQNSTSKICSVMADAGSVAVPVFVLK